MLGDRRLPAVVEPGLVARVARMSPASAAVADLLTQIRWELLRRRALRAIGFAAWVCVGVAILAVGVDLRYAAVDPVYLLWFAGTAVFIALASALAMRPSLSQAAAFADRNLEG